MNTFKLFAFAALAAGCACAAEPLRFDAEKVAVDPSVFTQNNNRPPDGKWDFWTKDRPDNIWRNKSTLRAPLCKADRAPEDPASGLFRVRLPLADGYYRIEARGGRAFGVAVGNGAFKKIEFRGVVADRVEVKGGFLELRVANCYATPSNPGWVYVDHFIAIPLGAGKPDAKKAETRKWSKVYEAEDVAVEKDKIVSGDRMVSGKWNLWANDPLKKRWSGEKALRGDVIRENRKVTAPEAAVLTFRIPVPKNVPCDIRFFGGRTVGVSFDGKFFRRLTNDTLLAGEIKSETGFVEFQIANCYAEDNPKHAGSPYIDRFVVTPTKNVTGFPPMLSPEPKVNYYKYSDRYFRVEAEDVAVEKNKIVPGDRIVPGKWNLWANDPWKHKWSGGKVLRSMPVMKDCSPEAPDAAKLTIRIPAAKFFAERGGKVRIVKGRPTAHDGTLVAWDKKGHAIDWKFTIGKPGRYELRLHRASPAEAVRSILCDGKTLGEVYLEPTGGMGFAAADWEVEAVKTAAGSVILDLAAGEHSLTMLNLDGAMQNLAYLHLVPAGPEGGSK